MATDNEVLVLASAIVEVAKALKSAKILSQQVIDHNLVQSIDWGNLSNSNASAVTAGGLIVNTSYTPAEISNAIGSLAEFLDYWNGAAVTTGNHGANMEKLVPPII